MSTPTEDSLEPGPDGKLISTEERMQIIQQQQQPETTPEKAAPVEGTTSPPTHHKHHIHLILLPQQSGTQCCSTSWCFPHPQLSMLYDWQDIHLLSTNIFVVKSVKKCLCYSVKIFVENGDGDVISVVDKDAWQIFEPVCSFKT